MRNWINLVENHTPPPEYDAADEAHYDALEKTGFFGAQGAGCIVMARSTGRLLLVLRSYQVEQPLTWGNLGGAHHADENPVTAAERELREETGYSGSVEMVPLYVFKSGSFTYRNYLAIIEDEFIPDLGWEAIEYTWVNAHNWPNPLHFGMEALFGDSSSMSIIDQYAEEFGEQDGEG